MAFQSMITHWIYKSALKSSKEKVCLFFLSSLTQGWSYAKPMMQLEVGQEWGKWSLGTQAK